MLLSYEHVSTQDQNLELQQDALKEARCERVFEDRANRAKAAHPVEATFKAADGVGAVHCQPVGPA